MLKAISISPSRSGQNLADKFIEFDAAPDKVDDGSLVRVRYQCSRPCRLAVEVVVSTLRKTSVVVFRRKWISSIARVYRIHQVRLRWPPSILYEHSFINRRLLDTHNVTVGAWLHHLDDGRGPGTMLRIYKVLRTTAASERPAEPSKVCPSWSAQLTWQTSGNRIHQCPHESGQTLNHVFILSHHHYPNLSWLLFVTFCCFTPTQTQSIC